MTSLLDRVHALIDRTYDLGTSDLDPSRFVIGDAGLLALHGRGAAAGRRLVPGVGAMLLVRSGGHGRASIYYPDRLIANLERNDPARGLSAANVRDFAAFVEELDHFLVVAARYRAALPVRALDLEIHANVTKVLVVSLFCARTLGVQRLGEAERDAVRWELLERGDYEAEEPALRERYRLARLHALRFLALLERTACAQRPALLRRFSRASLDEKMSLAA